MVRERSIWTSIVMFSRVAQGSNATHHQRLFFSASCRFSLVSTTSFYNQNQKTVLSTPSYLNNLGSSCMRLLSRPFNAVVVVVLMCDDFLDVGEFCFGRI